MTRYLTIPGWSGSGPGHWQTHWEHDLENASRVEMPDWFQPHRDPWLAALDAAVQASPEPPVLIAHSLGCHAVAHWAAGSTQRIRGALLVAPPDLERKACPPALRDFAPVARGRLRFPSRVVASDDDPYGALSTVIQMAFDWGSEISVLEAAGHINSDSGFGRWPEGRAWLTSFLDAKTRSELASSEASASAEPLHAERRAQG